MKPIIYLSIALSLVACGGGDLSVDGPRASDGTLDLAFPPGRADEHRLPLRVSGGLPPYDSSIDGCPDWVALFPDQGILAGTAPAGEHGKTFLCTYKVEDSSVAFPQSTSYLLRLAVGSPPRLALPSLVVRPFSVGVYYPVTLPPASGGVPPYTYAFTCTGGMLPPGMGFAPATRMFAGTPEVRFHDSCAYAATDSAEPPETVSRTVEVEVTADDLELARPGSMSPSVGTSFSEEFRAATGGVPPYTYSFTCASGTLPPGMEFAPATRVFAGIPRASFRDSCTYSVNDSSEPAAAASQTVEIDVTAPPLEVPEEVVPDNRVHLTVRQRARIEFPDATGGVKPYMHEILDEGCMLPSGVSFHPGSLILSGTPIETSHGPGCTYRVTDSDSPPASVTRSFELIVDPFDPGSWRFRTRSVDRSDHLLCKVSIRPAGACNPPASFAVLPHAIGGDVGTDAYEILGLQPPLSTIHGPRLLSYTHAGAYPIVGAPTTFRYQVFVNDGAGKRAHDALCVDIGYTSEVEQNEFSFFATVRVRDDAFWNGTEFRCPDAPSSSSSATRATVSNPVHSALAPVHARRAVDVAHAAVRDRVREWSPGSPRPRTAISPSVDFASLSGLSDGFDYAGSSESLSAGAELGAGFWQAGLVASFTRTDLRYDAAPSLSGLGYDTGEHDTEMFSVHPFAAWHAPFGGHVWASLGAGTGELRHRDDLGFPSWSRSDVQLGSYAVEASVPLADVLSGELGAEAGIESFALDIEGGGRISTTLPTLRGRGYRAGLAWSAPDSVTRSVSLAYRRLTGDGPEGARMEARGAVSVAGILDPRLTLRGSAEASLGLGDHEQDAWRLGGGVRFVPDGAGRGFELDLDTGLMSPDNGSSDGVGVRGEVGYGLWSGSFLGTLRPYVGLTRYPGRDAVRRSVGLDLLGTPTSQVSVEVHEHSRDPSRELEFMLRHRF